MSASPLVIVGHGRGRVFIETLARLGWGRMFVFDKPDPFPGEPWCLDNGAYFFWTHRLAFNEDLYRRNMERAAALETPPYMAVVPDVVGAGRRSLDFSLRWREIMPGHWPLYLAVQDGMTEAEVETVLGPFAGIFLGGTDSFKSTAARWSELAHARGKRFHYGRAGTLKKLELARAVLADSIDSTSMIRTRDKLDRFVERYLEGDPQLPLPMEE